MKTETTQPRWLPIDRHGNVLDRGNAHNAATWTMCEQDKPIHRGQCGDYGDMAECLPMTMVIVR